MTFTHHCSECGNQVDEFCAEHPSATIESIPSNIEALIAPARAAIARSEKYDEIVTIEGTPAIHSFLRSECDDSVERCVGSFAQLLTEYWANDPDSEDKMTWRVHVLDDPDARKSADELAADASARRSL